MKRSSHSYKSSYPLTSNSIDVVVTDTSPGICFLGHLNTDDEFVIEYVGRSDKDIKKRLHKWVGEYEAFAFQYCKDAEEAYRKECHYYHKFIEDVNIDNYIHPRKPEGMDSLSCPVPGCSL